MKIFLKMICDNATSLRFCLAALISFMMLWSQNAAIAQSPPQKLGSAAPNETATAASAAKNSAASTASHSDTSADLPRVFLLNSAKLQAKKEAFLSGDSAVVDAVNRLERDAKPLLEEKPTSVIEKDFAPPSGDKHDYMSQAPYYWADPNLPDGSPYTRRDGERNPEVYKYKNHQNMSRLADDVQTLGLAFYFTGNEAYAEKATQLLRVWFLDSATKMNPNLQYAQAVPGTNTGRGTGLIESRCLTGVVDAIGLLHGSRSWTDDNQHAMEEWFDKFLEWMRDSKNGRAEAAAKNNHGTHYDVQVTSFALFLGKTDLAKSILEEAGSKRISLQIEPDGSEPLELARTKAWGYSLFNLSGLMSLATLGDQVGVDLWNFHTDDGRSIRQAVDFLLPFATGDKKWSYQQLGGWSPAGFASVLRQAAVKYPDERYSAALAKLNGKDNNNWHDLLR